MEIVFMIIMALLALMVGRLLFATLIELAFALLIWAIVGYLTGRFIRGQGYGLVGNIALGLAGGITGSITLSLLGLGRIGHLPLVGGIIVGVIGGVIFVYLMRLIVRSNFAK